MNSNEFMRVNVENQIQRSEDFLNKERHIKRHLVELRLKYPSISSVQDSSTLILDDIHEDSSVIDLSSDIQRKEADKKIKGFELNAISELYKDKTEHSPIFLSEHHRQSHGLSCTLATALNVMEALNIRGNLIEADIARAIGSGGEDSPVVLDHTINYLKSKGLSVRELWNALDLIEVLEQGGVVSLTECPKGWAVPHQILISGVSIEQGKIEFIINDPLLKEKTGKTLAQVIEMINYEKPNMNAIEEPIKIEINNET